MRRITTLTCEDVPSSAARMNESDEGRNRTRMTGSKIAVTTQGADR